MKIFMANISKNNRDEGVYQGEYAIEEQQEKPPVNTVSDFNKTARSINNHLSPGFNPQ
jgi:hypothetical protein